MSTGLIDKLNRYGSVAREFEVRLPGKAIEKITGRGNYKVPVNTTYMAFFSLFPCLGSILKMKVLCFNRLKDKVNFFLASREKFLSQKI